MNIKIFNKFLSLLLSFSLLAPQLFAQAKIPYATSKDDSQESKLVLSLNKARQFADLKTPLYESMKGSLRKELESMTKEPVSEEQVRGYFDVLVESAQIDDKEVWEVATHFSKKPYGVEGDIISYQNSYYGKEYVCIENDPERCYDYTNFFQGALRSYIKYVVSPDANGKTWNREIILYAMPTVERLIMDVGYHKNDEDILLEFFKAALEDVSGSCNNDTYLVDIMPGLAYTFSGKSNGKKSEAERGKKERETQCSNVARAMVLLGVVAPSGKKDENANLIYQIMQDNYKSDYGVVVMTSGMASLIAFGTKNSYAKAEQFLTKELAPTGGAWKYLRQIGLALIDLISVQGWANKGISGVNSTRGGGGRYLNWKTEGYQFIDDATSMEYGLSAISLDAIKKTPSLGYNVAYGNVLEGLGTMIATTNTKEGNAIAERMLQKYITAEAARADCIAALNLNGGPLKSFIDSQSCDASRSVNLPLIVGILQSPSMKGSSAQKAAAYINGLDWWDLNEATQRRINNSVAGKNFQNTVKRDFNAAKKKRNDQNETIKNLSLWADIVIAAVAIGALVKSVPSMVRSFSSFTTKLARIRAINAGRVIGVSKNGKIPLLKAIKANNKASGIKTSKELRMLKQELAAASKKNNRAMARAEALAKTGPSTAREVTAVNSKVAKTAANKEAAAAALKAEHAAMAEARATQAAKAAHAEQVAAAEKASANPAIPITSKESAKEVMEFYTYLLKDDAKAATSQYNAAKESVLMSKEQLYHLHSMNYPATQYAKAINDAKKMSLWDKYVLKRGDYKALMQQADNASKELRFIESKITKLGNDVVFVDGVPFNTSSPVLKSLVQKKGLPMPKAEPTPGMEKAFTPKQQQSVNKWELVNHNISSLQKEIDNMGFLDKYLFKRTKNFSLNQQKLALQRELASAEHAMGQTGVKVVNGNPVRKPFADSFITPQGEEIFFENISISRRASIGGDNQGVTEVVRLNGKQIEMTDAQKALYRDYKVKNDLFTEAETILKRTDLTNTQRQRVLKAQNDIQHVKTKDFYNDIQWREIKANLRSPEANTNGFFFKGEGLEVAPGFTNESGYIAKFLGSGESGTSAYSMKQTLKEAGKMSDEILIHSNMHGRIDQFGWYSHLNKTEKLRMDGFVDMIQETRAAGQTKVVNLHLDNCNAGSAFDDFLKLPAKQKEGINLFAPAGGKRQLNSVSGIFTEKSNATVAESLYKSLTKDISGGMNTNIGAKAFINNQYVYPLEDAIKAASAGGNTQMATELKAIHSLMEANTAPELQSALANLQKVFKGNPGAEIVNGPKVTNFNLGAIDEAALVRNGEWAMIALPEEHAEFVASIAKAKKINFTAKPAAPKTPGVKPLEAKGQNTLIQKRNAYDNYERIQGEISQLQGRLSANKYSSDELMRGVSSKDLQSLNALKASREQVLSTLRSHGYATTSEGALYLKSSQMLSLEGNIASLKQVEESYGIGRPVWQVVNKEGATTSFLKYGNPSEITRAKEITEITQRHNFAKEIPGLEVDNAIIVSEGTQHLAPSLQKQLATELAATKNLRAAEFRISHPFTTKKVDTRGFTEKMLRDALNGGDETSVAPFKELLRNKPLTQSEWDKVVKYYETINKEGFFQTDLKRNLHLQRLENGNIKIATLDYEVSAMTINDMAELQSFEKALMSAGLKERAVTAYPSITPAASGAGRAASASAPANAAKTAGGEVKVQGVKNLKNASQELDEMSWLQRNITQKGKVQQLEGEIKAFNLKAEQFENEMLELIKTKQLEKATALQADFVETALNGNVLEAAKKETLAHYFNNFMAQRQGFMADLSPADYTVLNHNNISGIIEGGPVTFYLNGINSPAANTNWLINASNASGKGKGVVIPIGTNKAGFSLEEVVKTVQEMPSIGENPVFVAGVHGSCDASTALHMSSLSKNTQASVNGIMGSIGKAIEGKASKAYVFMEECFGGAAFEEYNAVKGVELITIAPGNGVNVVSNYNAFLSSNPYATAHNRIINNAFITAKYTVDGVPHYPLRQAVEQAKSLKGGFNGVHADRLQSELKALNDLFDIPAYTKWGVSNEKLIKKAVADLPEAIQRSGTGPTLYIENSLMGYVEAAYSLDPAKYTVIHVPQYIANYVSQASLPALKQAQASSMSAAATKNLQAVTQELKGMNFLQRYITQRPRAKALAENIKVFEQEIASANAQLAGLTAAPGSAAKGATVFTAESGASAAGFSAEEAGSKLSGWSAKSALEDAASIPSSSYTQEIINASRNTLPKLNQGEVIRGLTVNSPDEIVKILKEGQLVSETGAGGTLGGSGVYATTDASIARHWAEQSLYNPARGNIQVLIKLEGGSFKPYLAGDNVTLKSAVDVTADKIKEIYVLTKDGWTPALKAAGM